MDTPKWTVVLLVWMQMAIGNAFRILSEHDRSLDLLRDVMTQDTFWSHVLNQHVYHEFDRKLYPHIIDNELMKGARGVPKKPSSVASDETSSTIKDNATETSDKVPVETDKASADTAGEVDKTTVPLAPVKDPVIPIKFLRNLFAKWFHINSLVNEGLRIIQGAFKCLAYKHVTHMLTLVQKQISRKKSQQKALSWSEKAKQSIGWIVVKMGSIHISDTLLLQSMSFFRVYDRRNLSKSNSRFEFTPKLNYLSENMLNYINKNCLKSVRNDKDIALELKLLAKDALYSGVELKVIDDKDFKDMFKKSEEKISEQINQIPKTKKTMHPDRWNELLRYKKLTENDNEEDEILWIIDR